MCTAPLAPPSASLRAAPQRAAGGLGATPCSWSTYLRGARPELVETPKEPALFVAASTHRRINVKTLNLIVRKYAETAGIAKRVTPHVLRHTSATDLLRGGADIRQVQAILGHASVATTQIYTRVAVEDLVRVHRRHHPRTKLKIP